MLQRMLQRKMQILLFMQIKLV